MSTLFEIPLDARSQRFSITLKGVSYLMRLVYRRSGEGDVFLVDDLDEDIETAGGVDLIAPGSLEANWVLDIGTVEGIPLVCGIPLLPGVDLLAQYGYLGIGGQLQVVTYGEPDRVPVFSDLGVASHLIFVDPTNDA